MMLKSTYYCTQSKALTFCLLSTHLFRAFWITLKEAVGTCENFLSDGARICSAASALGTALPPTPTWYTVPLPGALWEHTERGSGTDSLEKGLHPSGPFQ